MAGGTSQATQIAFGVGLSLGISVGTAAVLDLSLCLKKQAAAEKRIGLLMGRPLEDRRRRGRHSSHLGYDGNSHRKRSPRTWFYWTDRMGECKGTLDQRVAPSSLRIYQYLYYKSLQS